MDKEYEEVQRLNTQLGDSAAFEIVTLSYDTFNAPLRPSSILVRAFGEVPFGPGAVGTQTATISQKDIYTAVGYIRRVRWSDGTVWQADDAALRKTIKTTLPGLKQIGLFSP
jgi:hypothetical protein